MIITMVIDQYSGENNGTTISTRRFVEALRNRGHEVRVVAAVDINQQLEEGVYPVGVRYVPIATEFAKKQGMWFAKADVKVLQAAIEGSDVVHVLMPFKLERTAVKIAKKFHIPVTGAFHVQAENVTSQIMLENFDFANKAVYKVFKNVFYKKLDHIHCPSEMIARELRKNHYKARLHVVSNGIENCFTRQEVERLDYLKGKFAILSIGRLSPEKRQDILIEAAKKSRYENKIQLVFAGKGPKEQELKELGQSLSRPPIFGFYTKDELITLINSCDLYAHPADIEIEAIACVEAFACGLVPVISDNEKCATKQFALCENSLFKNGDSTDLAQKIDFWIENDAQRKEMSARYETYGKEFFVENTIVKIEKMFEQAIAEHK